MTTEETALADKLLKEATETTDNITRRERLEDYNLLVRAACTRRDASGTGLCNMTATGIQPAAEAPDSITT